MKKKIFSLVLATAVCTATVACGGNNAGGTTAGSTTTGITTVTTVGTSNTTNGTVGTGATTTQITTSQTQGGMLKPQVDPNVTDPVTIDLEGYAKLVYNPAYCDIEYKIEKGIGTKRNITVSVKMKDGYVFDGWSKATGTSNNGAMANGIAADSTETTYTYSVSKSQNTTIWANYSAQIVYHPNGGTVSGGGDTYTQKYSVVWYKSPNTLPVQDYFYNSGYTLVEYNTKADGSGESVSPGSKVALTDSGVKELYCIWEKQNDASDFTTQSVSGGVAITGYNGTSQNVVIPDVIGSKKVVSIAGGAFNSSNITRVVLSKNTTTVESGAFKNCTKLESFVMFDNVTTISDDSFSGSALKNLQVNAVLNLYNNWTTSFAGSKMDRLIWAKENGKKVIVIYGGSGTLYGWNSDAIEKAFGGEYVVVNLGTNANVTAAMYFEACEKLLTKDDILLWSPETGASPFGSTSMSSVRSWEINAGHYDIFKQIDISEYPYVFSSYAQYAVSHTNNQKNFDSFSPNVTVEGDGLDQTNRGSGYSYNNEYERMLSQIKGNTFDYMAELIKKLDAKGVKVFHTYAAMDENGKDSIDYDYITNTFEKAFKEKFQGVEMISDIKDCFVKNENMGDSKWHITPAGAEERTAVVIEDLKTALGK